MKLKKLVIPDWNPPKPTLRACILSILELFHGGAFYTDKFRLSIQNSFIETGTAPLDDNYNFRKYCSHNNKGNLTLAPTDTVDSKIFEQQSLLCEALICHFLDDSDDDDDNL